MAARSAQVDDFDDVVCVPRLRPLIDDDADWDLPAAEGSNPPSRAVDIDVELVTMEATQNGSDASLSPRVREEPADRDGDGSRNGAGPLRGRSSKRKSYARLAEEGILPRSEHSHTSAGPGAAEEAETDPESKGTAMIEDTSVIVPPDVSTPLTAPALCLIALVSLVLTVAILLLTGAATAPKGILAAGTSTVRTLLNGDDGAAVSMPPPLPASMTSEVLPLRRLASPVSAS